MMHFYGPGMFLAPFALGFGLLRLVLFVGLIVLLVRLVGGHRHGYHHAWAHHGYAAVDPYRIAAARYASGHITRDEYDRIVRDLDAAPGAPTPPAA